MSIKNMRTYEFIPYKIEIIEYPVNKSGKLPTPRSGHRAVCTNGNLYCLGGFNPEHRQIPRRGRPSTSLFQELWKFHFATKEWELCIDSHAKDMPEELASNAVTLKNNILFVFGGTAYPFGEACSNQCYIFNVDKSITNVIRLPVEGDLPTPQYGPAIVMHDHYLYAIGGTTGFEYSCDVYRLDLTTARWESVYKCKFGDPSGRYRHEIVYTGKFIYVLGGGTAQTAFDLTVLPVFDLEKNCWNYIKTNPDTNLKNEGYPGARKCHSCIQYNTDNGIEAVIAGGSGNNDIYYNDVWKLHLNKMQWELLATTKLPNPIYFHSAATAGNGCMYLFGGIEIEMQSTLTRTNELYKIWTTIPKLSEICWDAICYYNTNLNRYTKDELLRFGVPKKFIERIISEDI